jgi:hypothetical protein
VEGFGRCADGIKIRRGTGKKGKKGQKQNEGKQVPLVSMHLSSRRVFSG